MKQMQRPSTEGWSMELLMGRALGNNPINMTAYKEVKEALKRWTSI